jgi:hypothetical protein
MTTAIGWIGAALVVVTYAQKNMRQLRYISLLASTAMLIYGLALRIWPNVTLELILSAINIRRLVQLRSERAVREVHEARPVIAS